MTTLVEDALAISAQWQVDLDLFTTVQHQLEVADLTHGQTTVDIVAIGKAARAMAAQSRRVLHDRVRRQLVVATRHDGPENSPREEGLLFGDHPVPGDDSLIAGRRLVEFLAEPTSATHTLFLISGGASSLCVVPETPMELGDLDELWRAALVSGIDITTLNQLRASTSGIAGGAILRHVTTPHSVSFIMVDNVISGAPWVASGLTYDYVASPAEFETLIERVGLASSRVATKMRTAFANRADVMARPVTTMHTNRVLADPSMVHDVVSAAALRRGFRVVDMGSAIYGDVADVSAAWAARIESEGPAATPTCLIGVGELTVRVTGDGRGGRCQEFALRMAEPLAKLSRASAFVARSTDGQDFISGVAGAWVDETTLARIESLGIDWREVLTRHDSFPALRALDQLVSSHGRSWNLCDVYVALW